ncbi:MAG: DUF3943 domain-containing protein [Calditrichia bacterium]
MLRKYTLFLLTISLFISTLGQGQVFNQKDSTTLPLLFSMKNPQKMLQQPEVEPEMGTNFCCEKKYFWVAMGELIALQVLPWYFNRHVADDTTADLSFKSWGHNLRAGMEWDPNAFSGNMFQHPFHGSVFYNTARSNGYSYWESVPFAFAGSMMWEMFGENNLGAINDWAMTSLGGIAIGETFHRAAIMLRDNTMRGAGRTFRELGAFFFDPVGSFNRVVRGEWSKVGPNPENRFPGELRTYSMLGWRAIGEGRLRNAGKTLGFWFMQMNYGDPMEDYEHPFDSFRLILQINSREEKTRIAWLSVSGALTGSVIKDNDKVKHVFTIDQLYDYTDNQTYQVGGQSFSFGVQSLWKLSPKTQIQTVFQPSLWPMTGIVSENTLVGDRDYDFGSGFGLRLGGTYIRNGFPYFTLLYRGIFSHTLNGSKGNQIVQFLYSRLRFPVWRSVGIGIAYLLYTRDTYLRDFDDIHRTNPELRFGVTFSWDTFN